MRYIDLNSDVGEGFGQYDSFEKNELYNTITSANIACGYHGGDPNIMDYTCGLCNKAMVEIGAHPGFPDLLGFGRRKMDISFNEAANYCLYQLGALNAIAKTHKKKIQHLKLHGAFYNMVMKDYKLSQYIIKRVKELDNNLIFLGLSNSNFISACKEEKVRFANEIFADRAYDKDGNLVSRKIPGAVIIDKTKAIDQVKNIVLYGEVKTIEGSKVKLNTDSICIHGDNKEALDFAQEIRRILEGEGVIFESLKSFV